MRQTKNNIKRHLESANEKILRKNDQFRQEQEELKKRAQTRQDTLRVVKNNVKRRLESANETIWRSNNQIHQERKELKKAERRQSSLRVVKNNVKRQLESSKAEVKIKDDTIASLVREKAARDTALISLVEANYSVTAYRIEREPEDRDDLVQVGLPNSVPASRPQLYIHKEEKPRYLGSDTNL